MTACSYNRSSLQAFPPVGIRRQKIDQCSDSLKVLERQTIILNVIFFKKATRQIMVHQIFNLRAIGLYTSCDWKLGNIRVMFSDFQNCACCKKHIWRIRNTIASIWRKMYSDIWPWTLSVPRSSQFSLSYSLRKLCCIYIQTIASIWRESMLGSFVRVHYLWALR